jgi:hypothetical protein
VTAHNKSVRTGNWGGFGAWFADDAELVFEGIPIGPFRGSAEIENAYRERPPDDEVMTFSVSENRETAVARYGWRRGPNIVAGRLQLTASGGRIAKLVVGVD